MSDWPRVVEHDDGIRPAGPPDRCFYCNRAIGEEHARTCVTVQKLVRVTFHVDVDVQVPHHWDRDDILFHYNDSSWCADNAVDIIDKQENEGCLCNRFSCTVGPAPVLDDTPRTEAPRAQVRWTTGDES